MELISFEAAFYKSGDFVYDTERGYRFAMNRKEDGTFFIREDNDGLECETGEEFATKLQKLIRDYNLVKFNGVQKKTNGIPSEYGPYELTAKYASGEKLSFYMNGNPSDEWTGAVLDLFAKEFGSHGIEDLLPPKEDSIISRFELEFTFGDMRYSYGELSVPVTEETKNRTLEDVATNGAGGEGYVVVVFADCWDRSGKTESKERPMAIPTAEHYATLQEIVEDVGLVSFYNGKTFPGGFDYQNTPQYYEFYVEYESGKVLCGFSDDTDACAKFKPIAERFSEYYEDFVKKNEVDLND